MLKYSLIALAVIGLFAASGPPAAAGGAEAIKYRQNVMKSIGGHMGAIAAYVKGEVDHATHLSVHANALRETSKTVGALFPKGSGPEAGKTRALPKIWEDWSGVQASVSALEAATARFAEVAAGTTDRKALGAALGQVGKSCGGCHKPYRTK